MSERNSKPSPKSSKSSKPKTSPDKGLGGPPRSLNRGILLSPEEFAEAAAPAEGKKDRGDKKAVWAAHKSEAPETMVVDFCAGRDVRVRPAADAELIPYDIWTNAAHVLMLKRQEIISSTHARKILDALKEIEADYARGEFSLDPALEDVHINIEREVGRRTEPEIAGRMHTGRSRNDQAATDMRLWLRDRMIEVKAEAQYLVKVLLARAEDWCEMPMPGYTHQQPGMIGSLGYWAAGHAQALARDLLRLRHAYEMINQSPLGSAAGFGTSWPLDRFLTSNLLGFSEVQKVGLDCVTNRWEAEATCVQALAFMMTHFSMLAQDLILMTSPPHKFLLLPERLTTGSSIMPQKRNPDFAEVIRAKTAHVDGHLMALLAQAKGMISGYNRDSQWSKYAVMDCFEEVRHAPSVLGVVLESTEPNAKAMEAACREGFLNAVEVSDHLCRKFKLDFRTSYAVLGEAVSECRERGVLDKKTVEKHLAKAGVNDPIDPADWANLVDPHALLNERKSAGSPAPDLLREALQGISEHLDESVRRLERNKSWLLRTTETLRRLRDELSAT